MYSLNKVGSEMALPFFFPIKSPAPLLNIRVSACAVTHPGHLESIKHALNVVEAAGVEQNR